MGEILEARYLTVDLIVEAAFDLSSITEALKDRVFILYEHSSSEASSFGIESNSGDSESPEEDIVELLDVLYELPENLKNVLRLCKKKVFDIGFECGSLQDPIDAPLSAETIHRISTLGGQINIRLYPWVETPRR